MPESMKHHTRKDIKNTQKKKHHTHAHVRAENEDDDGYDPFSDYMDKRVPEPLFERDPWK